MTSRTVYSTEKGRMCPGCGWPASNCQCSSRTAHAPVPSRIIAKLRMEKKGRGGKMVTVIDGLPRNDTFLKELAQELKRSCATGGTVTDGAIELHGDMRERLRELLAQRGCTVKG